MGIVQSQIDRCFDLFIPILLPEMIITTLQGSLKFKLHNLTLKFKSSRELGSKCAFSIISKEIQRRVSKRHTRNITGGKLEKF